MAVNMKMLTAFVMAIATIALIGTVIPSIGSGVETNMPVNSTTSYADAPTGGSLWTDGMTSVGGVIGIGATLIILGWLGIKLFA